MQRQGRQHNTMLLVRLAAAAIGASPALAQQQQQLGSGVAMHGGATCGEMQGETDRGFRGLT
jgi:hypothetical protein